MIIPKTPDSSWLNSLLTPTLRDVQSYRISAYPNLVKLDQNEIPFPWPDDVKDEVCRRAKAWDWNRYPPAYNQELLGLLATHLQVPASCLLLSHGSNHLITVVMHTFCRHLASRESGGELWILRPSFPLFEDHARNFDIPYKPWLLMADFSFDLKALDRLPPRSVVLFATPNNPTGSTLTRVQMSQLLERHPQSLFIADEAYFDFSSENFVHLLGTYENLLLLRTFSKTLAGAGLRLGYLLGAEGYVQQAQKLMLPYTINAFIFEAAKQVLTNPRMREFVASHIRLVVQEKNRQFQALSEISKPKGFVVFPSEANSLLLKWPTQEAKERAFQHLLKGGCLLRDVSQGKGLEGCLRLGIGTEEENALVRRLLTSLT